MRLLHYMYLYVLHLVFKPSIPCIYPLYIPMPMPIRSNSGFKMFRRNRTNTFSQTRSTVRFTLAMTFRSLTNCALSWPRSSKVGYVLCCCGINRVEVARLQRPRYNYRGRGFSKILVRDSYISVFLRTTPQSYFMLESSMFSHRFYCFRSV